MNEVNLRIEEQQAVIAGLEAERLLHANRGDVGIVHAITALLAGERARLNFWLRRAQAREDSGEPITLLIRPGNLRLTYKRVIAAATVTIGSASTSHIVIDEVTGVHAVHVILNRRKDTVWAMRIHDDGAGVWWKAPNMPDEAALTNVAPLPPGSVLRIGEWRSNPALITVDPI